MKITARTCAVAAGTALLAASVANGNLVVDQDLGMLGFGSTNLIGTTVGANRNADFYPPITFDETLGEFVYQLTLNQPTLLSLTNNEGFFVGADNDHFLLNSLNVDVDGNATGLVGFVDELGAFGIYNPGTYFLSVDTFGFSFEGAYDITLEAQAAPPPPPAIDLGVVGTDADPFNANTFGSDFDTEIGLYDGIGNLLGANDDSGGNLQSQLEADSLPAGQYFLAVSGFNTSFDLGFAVDAGASSGSLSVSVNGVTDSRLHETGTVTWYTFEIVPAPGAVALLGIGGLAAVRRRR